jgi:ATP-dependent Zn protease
MDEDFGLAVPSAEEKRAMYPVIRERINGILRAELAEAIRLIEENRMAIDDLTAALLEKNHLKGDEIDALFAASGAVRSVR